MTARIILLGSVVSALILGAVALATGIASAGAKSDQALLPDFDIVTPQGLLLHRTFVSGKPHWKLGFISASYNKGPGAAMVTGERSPLRPAEMVAAQIIQRADGSTSTIPNIGTMKYAVEPTHEHWHLLRFMAYELRRISDYKLVRPDEKRGYCLGDRFKVPKLRIAGTPAKAVFTFDCAGKQPDATSVEEGMSVGWGDDYTQLRDGQDIDITGVPAGVYYLVNRVNPLRRLKESDYKNNTSSLRLKIAWPGGPTKKPITTILAACTNTDHCRSGTFYDQLR
jgi:hypothetical protein